MSDTAKADDDDDRPGCRILALYKFVSPHWEQGYVQQLQHELQGVLRNHHVVGNLLISQEGINGTVSYTLPPSRRRGNDDEEDELYQYFVQTFPNIRLRKSFHKDTAVFHRLRIRVKKEIVTLGVPNLDPCIRAGTYVKPGPEWHALLKDTEHTLVIDTRNAYEVLLGTFPNAVNPGTTSFTEFPGWFHTQIQAKQPKRIAMFCTGGIRCEKASAFCLNHPIVSASGIPVYHLKGGILAYLDTVPVTESMWQGECFVFDQRTAVGHGLRPSQEFTLCHACRHPLTHVDRGSADFVPGIHCPYCMHRDDKASRRDRYQERQKQCQLLSSGAVGGGTNRT